MIMTSNLPFEKGMATVDDKRLTDALLVRLIHHVYILDMNGRPCRLA
jgi:DNA replication protein DnaC